MHTCPDCGQACSCNGDIDDCLDICEEDADNCIHDCDSSDDEEDDEGEVDGDTRFPALYRAVNEMMSALGCHGTISARDDRVQAVMDALYDIDGGTFSDHAHFAKQGAEPVAYISDADLARLIADKWADMVMVPREPTDEMIEAAGVGWENSGPGLWNAWIAVYKSMLAAAPTKKEGT